MIDIREVEKVYNQGRANEFVALKHINLHVEKGECVILKGVSGSGKSTLLSLLCGLNRPTKGGLVVAGENIAKYPDIMISAYRLNTIGFIPQAFNLIDGLSVYENVQAPLSLTQVATDEVAKRVEKAMELANIGHKSTQAVGSLSGGEKQRCAIARALVMNPNVILADEPTANLDKNNSLAFIDLLKKFKELGKTVVVATHDMCFDELDFVDKYFHIEDGMIKQ